MFNHQFETYFLGVPFKSGQPHASVAEVPRLFRKSSEFRQMQGRDLGDIKLSSVNPLEDCQAIEQEIKKLNLGQNSFLQMMGGDHGMSLGTISGLLHHYQNLCVVWVDAHADANTWERSKTKNMHGMPLSWLTGEAKLPWQTHFLNPKNLIYVGLRSIDDYEMGWLNERGIKWISSEDWKSFGPIWLSKTLKEINPTNVHLSIDVDVLDAEFISATGCPVDGGLSMFDLVHLVECLKYYPIRSTEFVEVHPSFAKSAKELTQLWSLISTLYKLASFHGQVLEQEKFSLFGNWPIKSL